jgi:hypothetical protein
MVSVGGNVCSKIVQSIVALQVTGQGVTHLKPNVKVLTTEDKFQ